MISEKRYIYIESKDKKHHYRVDLKDLNATFERNYSINNNYEISFTITYTNAFKDAFNSAKGKISVWYNDQWYVIESWDPGINEQGMTTLKLTCVHTIVDHLKNIRKDDPEPTKDHPQTSTSTTSGSNSDSDQPQAGVVIKKVAEKQTYSLDSCLHTFLDGNDQGIKYEVHGVFPSLSVECKGSLFDWLRNTLKDFGAFWVPDGSTIKIYDLTSLKHPTGKVFRYMSNMTNVDLQFDVHDLVNDCWCYAGKMEKDTTTVSGGGNGINEPVNGDWTPVIKNAAGLVGEHLSQSDINLVLAQIRLESGGNETILGGDDGLADGRATGLLQFKPGTFNYYCRPPYTTITHGLDQLVALFNIPNWRNQITGHSGWSPHGAPISKATIQVQQASSSEGANSIVSFCRSFVGKVPYVWGGSSTSGWDCSGFVCYVLNHFGINTPRTNTVGLESKGTQVGPPYQTGDLLFWGPHGKSYHVSIAMNSTYRVGADNYNDGTVYRTIASWPPDFAVRVPGFSSGNATNGSDGDSTSTTTKEVYYSLVYHYEDQDSIKEYGRYRGAPIVEDSIYDMNILKQYVENKVQHNPATVLTIKGIRASDAQLGDVWKIIAPELNFNADVTLMNFKGNVDDFDPGAEVNLSFNNTGLPMRDVNAAIWKDINDVNVSIDPLKISSGSAERHENHLDNEGNKKNPDDKGSNTVGYSGDDMKNLSDFTNGKDVKMNDR